MNSATADFNHPLAGKAVAYEVEVAGINDRFSASSSTYESACYCSRGAISDLHK